MVLSNYLSLDHFIIISWRKLLIKRHTVWLSFGAICNPVDCWILRYYYLANLQKGTNYYVRLWHTNHNLEVVYQASHCNFILLTHILLLAKKKNWKMTSQTIVSVVLFRNLYVQSVCLSLQMISEFLFPLWDITYC